MNNIHRSEPGSEAKARKQPRKAEQKAPKEGGGYSADNITAQKLTRNGGMQLTGCLPASECEHLGTIVLRCRIHPAREPSVAQPQGGEFDELGHYRPQ